jgi:hypothetical protein
MLQVGVTGIHQQTKEVNTSFGSSVWAESTAHADMNLNLRPCKTTVVHGLLTPDCEARIQYCRRFQESAINGLTDPELKFYSEEAWFNLNSYVNSQNNRYYSTQNPHAVHEVPLHNLNVGAISERWIIGIGRFHDTITSGRYILPPFFDQLLTNKNRTGVLCKVLKR